MKTIQSMLLKPGLIFGCLIALTLLLCLGGQAFAARVAGSGETVNTAPVPGGGGEVLIVAPSQTPAPAVPEAVSPEQNKEAATTPGVEKKDPDAIRPEAEVKADGTATKPETDKEEKQPAKKKGSQKYVFDPCVTKRMLLLPVFSFESWILSSV